MEPRKVTSGPVRQSWQDAMRLTKVSSHSGKDAVARYVGTTSGWLPGLDLLEIAQKSNKLYALPDPGHRATFGGHAYCQAGLAVCRALAEGERKDGVAKGKRLGLHTMHGYFSSIGLSDRPFVYDVQLLTTSRRFGTYQVTVRQPTKASSVKDNFPLSDADQQLAPVTLSACLSFKVAEDHTAKTEAQEPSAQTRFAPILGSRPMDAWPPAPPADIDSLVAALGTDIVGSFPGLDMRKVDMKAFNAGKPMHERRELHLYRLLQPLPLDSAVDDSGVDGGSRWDANSHALLHAFAADRNGLLVALNNLGHGDAYGRVASLSNSFVLHVNVEEAVMDVRYAADGTTERTDGWWIHEMRFPRAGAGRAIVMSLMWSPEGLHVATGYQDGLCRRMDSAKRERPHSATGGKEKL